MCPGPWLTATMGELSHRSAWGHPNMGRHCPDPWLHDSMTVWLYDSMHDCIMTCDCMMTCDILTPRHGSSWQHTAATHFSCTSQCKYFTFRRSYGGFGQVYTLYYREQEECRSEIENVRAGMRTFIITSDEDIISMKHIILSDMEHMFGWLWTILNNNINNPFVHSNAATVVLLSVSQYSAPKDKLVSGSPSPLL